MTVSEWGDSCEWKQNGGGQQCGFVDGAREADLSGLRSTQVDVKELYMIPFVLGCRALWVDDEGAYRFNVGEGRQVTS